MDWYKNKRIVLTGATSGIGLLLLEKLAASGAFIVAVGRNLSAITETSNVYPFKCDVSRQENVDEMFRFAQAKMGGIDIFFANAGFGYSEELLKADWDHIDNIYRTNVYSPIYSLEKMIELCDGKEFSFVITGSGVAETPLTGFALYTSTKFALDGFSQVMQMDLPGNVNLTTVYPVAMETEFFKRSGEVASMPTTFQQKPDVFIDKMMKGVVRKRKYIRPMLLFNLTVWFINVFPFLKTHGLKWSAKRMKAKKV